MASVPSGSLPIRYPFEDIGGELPRPPMAAMRALLTSGVVISPRGWSALTVDIRLELARVGSEEVVDLGAVQQWIRAAAVSELRLVPRLTEAPAGQVPAALANALAPSRRVGVEQWRRLRPLDRYVLSALSLNPRLLWRAIQEILPEAVVGSETSPWKSTLARCEVAMRDAAPSYSAHPPSANPRPPAPAPGPYASRMAHPAPTHSEARPSAQVAPAPPKSRSTPLTQLPSTASAGPTVHRSTIQAAGTSGQALLFALLGLLLLLLVIVTAILVVVVRAP